MPTELELLPCPFCGGDAERIDFGPGDAENEGGSCISCTRCQASGNVEFGRKENFISNWNRRAAALQAQQPGAQAVGVIRENPDDIGLYADFDTMPPVGTKLYTQPPSIPEPSEDDVEEARVAYENLPVPAYSDERWMYALTTYTARLRERIGQAP